MHGLRLKLALVGPTGREVRSRSFDARADYQAYLRPGETGPISALIYEERRAPEIDHVELSVETADLATAAATYAPAIPILVDWTFDQPSHIDVEIQERDSRLTDAIGGQLHVLTLSVHNAGGRAVQSLLLDVTWLDPAGAAITSERLFMVPSTGPAMQSGETWAGRVYGNFPDSRIEPYARYVVTVAEAS